MELTLQDLINNRIFDEIATCFSSSSDAYLLLASIAFPDAFRPNFAAQPNPAEFWRLVITEIEKGRVDGGVELLLRAAHQRLPANRVFQPFAPATAPATLPPPIEFAGSYDAFISYSSKDRALVTQLGNALNKQGLRVWMDQWELQGGSNFVTEIGEILQSVRAVIVCYGSDGYGPWQQAEVDIALDRQVRGQCLIIPVMLPNVTPKDLPPFLRRLNAVRIDSSIILQIHAVTQAAANIAQTIKNT